jgi:hypothetical protein
VPFGAVVTLDDENLNDKERVVLLWAMPGKPI